MNDKKTFSAARRKLLLTSALSAAMPSIFAQTRLVGGPVKIIVPFTPGTTTDLCARAINPGISKGVGQSVIVDNRPGASGIIGMDAVAKAAADGTTMLASTNTAFTLPFFYKKVPFDVIESFQPIGMIGYFNFALVAHSSLPASNTAELIAYLKKNPGKVDYASPGNGTLHHLLMDQIGKLTGTAMNHIPYKGSAGAFSDLAGGHVMLAIMPLNTAVSMQSGGRLKILGSTRRERDPLFPNIPSLHEGGVTGFDADGWAALWGPKGMSKELVALYSSVLNATLNSPETRAALHQNGVNPNPGTPEELLKTARITYDYWGRVIREAKIQPE